MMPEKTDCFQCALIELCIHGFELMHGMRTHDQAIGQCPDFLPSRKEVLHLWPDQQSGAS